jgi:hypothetical protein
VHAPVTGQIMIRNNPCWGIDNSKRNMQML